jgi:hypothetical protein
MTDCSRMSSLVWKLTIRTLKIQVQNIYLKKKEDKICSAYCKYLQNIYFNLLM